MIILSAILPYSASPSPSAPEVFFLPCCTFFQPCTDVCPEYPGQQRGDNTHFTLLTDRN